MASIKLAGATLNQIPFHWKNNLANIKEAIQEAQKEKVDILCLPELCITGYGCEDLFLSHWLPEKAVSLLDEIKKHCEEITVVVGLPIIYENHTYNCACIIHHQEVIGIYAKQNMATDGVHYEPRWFTPWPPDKISNIKIGENVYPFGDILVELYGAKIGFEICEDAWRENRPASKLMKKGVNIILNPSASHFAIGKSKLREALVINSSANFKCTYVYANLLGNEAGRMIYDGDILIAQNGRLIGRNKTLSFKNVNLLMVNISANVSEELAPAIAPYEIDEFSEFNNAEALALYDYMRKSRSQGFVLSLSGGADSSTCAVLVAEMVKRGTRELGYDLFLTKGGFPQWIGEVQSIAGEENKNKYIVNKLLTCAYQATVNSSEDTLHSAKILAESIGAQWHVWHIDEEVKSYTTKIEHALGRPLHWETDDIALQNIQARARSPIIWMMANIKNALLLTTSNRSEGDVGYTTMDGDTSGSIAPIAAIDKYFILNWLKWAEKEFKYNGLAKVNQLNPSAELRPLEQTQTDEEDLMPYKVIVAIERLAIRDRQSPKAIFYALNEAELEPEDLLKSHIIKFFRLWARNQWKRERIAPSFHLDDFNVDPRTWCRFPILSSGFEEELEELMQL